MASPFHSVRRHLGVSVPLFVVYAAVVIWAARGEVDARIVLALAVVLIATLLTPAALSALNRKALRGSWTPALQPGERVLHDGPADRYDAGYFGWLFLTDRRLVLYRVGGDEAWSAPLGAMAEARATRYAGIVGSDLRVRMRDGAAETLRVEANREWEEKIADARRRLSP